MYSVYHTFAGIHDYHLRHYCCVSSAAGEVASTLSHVMVTNPTKKILGETQSRLADIIAETQRNFTKLMLSLGKRENSAERYMYVCKTCGLHVQCT